MNRQYDTNAHADKQLVNSEYVNLNISSSCYMLDLWNSICPHNC